MVSCRFSLRLYYDCHFIFVIICWVLLLLLLDFYFWEGKHSAVSVAIMSRSSTQSSLEYMVLKHHCGSVSKFHLHHRRATGGRHQVHRLSPILRAAPRQFPPSPQDRFSSRPVWPPTCFVADNDPELRISCLYFLSAEIMSVQNYTDLIVFPI